MWLTLCCRGPTTTPLLIQTFWQLLEELDELILHPACAIMDRFMGIRRTVEKNHLHPPIPAMAMTSIIPPIPLILIKSKTPCDTKVKFLPLA